MSGATEQVTCLNCGAPIAGKFCAQCGQRAIPPYPSIREFAGDAWQELSGWDGRILRTFRALVQRPGALTRDMLEGRRARYISPVRLYLIASVAYFLIAAVAPNLEVRHPETGRMVAFKIGLWTTPDRSVALTAEERAEVDGMVEKAPPLLKPLMVSMRDEPEELQRRMLTAMPKVLFVLLPLFAGILSIFFWRRPYSQHLTFALHLHAVIFLALAAVKLPNFLGNVILALAIAIPALLFMAVYALRGLRRVYESPWPTTILKAAGIFTVYAVVSVPFLIAALAWAVYVR